MLLGLPDASHVIGVLNVLLVLHLSSPFASSVLLMLELSSPFSRSILLLLCALVVLDNSSFTVVDH